VPLIVRWPDGRDAGTVREDLVTLMDLGPTVISLAGGKVPGNMQGRVILGEKTGKEPEYVFATRDRMDEVHDMQRSARDRRYRYVRNFYPERPYSQVVSYQERSPIWKEWRRLDAEGKLEGAPALFMAKEKPGEELYDLEGDPDEVRNLAGDPAHKERLVAMRGAVEAWMKRIGDKGMEPDAGAVDGPGKGRRRGKGSGD
jgi:arylsulfatase A-like enzyme